MLIERLRERAAIVELHLVTTLLIGKSFSLEKERVCVRVWRGGCRFIFDYHKPPTAVGGGILFKNSK